MSWTNTVLLRQQNSFKFLPARVRKQLVHAAHIARLLRLPLVETQRARNLYDAQVRLVYANAGLVFERRLLPAFEIVKNEKVRLWFFVFDLAHGVHVARVVDIVVDLTRRTILYPAPVAFTVHPIVY